MVIVPLSIKDCQFYTDILMEAKSWIVMGACFPARTSSLNYTIFLADEGPTLAIVAKSLDYAV